MLYRETGQFKTTYVADQAIFPILQDRIGLWLILAVAFVGVPLVATEYLYTAILIPFLILALAAAIIALSLYVNRSWMGTALRAVAQDEDAARTIGIDVPRFKLAAFIIGTAAAGLAGGLYAYMTQLIVPDAFNFVQSVTILAMVVVGGIGSTWGVVMGAVILTLMPEMFRFINDYKLLVYGALLLLVMRFYSGGLAAMADRLIAAVRR